MPPTLDTAAINASMLRPDPSRVELLVLGAGWTSTFLLPLLAASHVSHAATTTTGRDGTIPYTFDPDSHDPAPYKRLPAAQTVLITFPLKGAGPSARLASLYNDAHGATATRFIQLGATSIWTAQGWSTARSAYDTSNARAVAEDELLAPPIRGAVLDLAGLYGGARQPAAWLGRVLQSKEDVRTKQALHMVHGADVARGILGAHRNWDAVAGRRWLVTDLRTYDWWDLALSWAARDDAGDKGREIQRWVWECMDEGGVRAVPRGPEALGRVLDARDFWRAVALLPEVGRLA